MSPHSSQETSFCAPFTSFQNIAPGFRRRHSGPIDELHARRILQLAQGFLLGFGIHIEKFIEEPGPARLQAQRVAGEQIPAVDEVTHGPRRMAGRHDPFASIRGRIFNIDVF